MKPLLEHLHERRWVVTLQKIQDPVIAIKFLEVIWVGKTHVVSEAIIDRVQVYPTLKNVKDVQVFMEI